MSSSFKHLKRGECPICNGSRNDCRKSTRNGLIHCHDNSVTSVPGYRFIKQDAIGFNIWAVDDGHKAWPEDRLRDWKNQQEVKQQQRENEEARRRARLLSLEERDRQYRILNQQLTLTARHRQILNDRMLTDADIDKAFELDAIRTWNPGQRITGVSPDLAGVDFSQQLVSVDGIAIYAFDAEGRITGAQLKSDNESFGKYLWISSANKKGNSPHLPNGDLPLFCWKHPGDIIISEVWLCEGALKSLLVALHLWRIGRTDIAVIGTASSARYGKKTLEKYLLKFGAKTIRLMPDAGAVINPTIHEANQRTLRLCQHLGYNCTIGWWGQVDKSHPDIDELSSFDKVVYLTPEDFLTEANRAQYQKRVKEVQLKLNTITHPAIEVDQRYLDVTFTKSAAAIQFIKSPMGTGKTELIKKLRAECQDNDKRLLLLGSRNGLLYQTCSRAEIEHLRNLQVPGEVGITGLALRNTDTLAMCVDSLWRLQAEDWRRATIIIDEAESVIDHLLVGNTCSSRRAALCTKLGEFIQAVVGSGGRVILMDAHLTDVPLDYIKSLAPTDTAIAGVINRWMPEQRWKVWFHNGTSDGVHHFINDDSAILEAIITCLQSGGIPVIPTDTQLGGEALQRQLEEAGYSGGLRVDGVTSESDLRVQAFLENPNEWLRQNRPPWLIYSPTAESGLSIDEPHFTEMFALFKGVLTTKTQMQMLGRVRPSIPRHIFTCERGLKDDDCSRQIPDEIEARLLQYHASNNLAIELAGYLSQSDDPTDAERLASLNRLADPSGGWSNPHLKTWAKLKARTNYALVNLRDELRAALVAAGHEVADTVLFRDCELKEEFTQLKEDIKLERATARAEAKDISIDQARTILRSDSSKVDERNQAYKAVLADQVPGVPLSAEFILKAQIENRGEWLKAIKLDWMLQHPDVQAHLDRQAWAWHLQQPFVSVQDVRAYSLKLKALKALGIHELLDRDRVYNCESEDTRNFIDRARGKGRHLRVLGLTLNMKTDPILFIKRLLKKVGAKLTCFDRRKGKRFYRVATDYWIDGDRLAVLAAFDLKFSSILKSDSEMAETQSQQAIEVCQHSQKEYINNGECWQGQEPATSVPINGDIPDTSTQDESFQETAWGIGVAAPGSIVECLGRAGQWIVKYCTSEFAKIMDFYGNEEYANPANLRLA